MHLGDQGTAFLPDGGILPAGPYPVYASFEVDDDGAAEGEAHFACEPKHPPPISIGTEFNVHVPHPESMLGDTVILLMPFWGLSSAALGVRYRHSLDSLASVQQCGCQPLTFIAASRTCSVFVTDCSPCLAAQPPLPDNLMHTTRG